MEYDYKKIYKTFNISFFSKNIEFSGDYFVDSHELQDYEEIEKLTKNLIIVLIEKFKFRISFRKNANFSNEIIICDHYDFDPNRLKHEDSLIKIAIVKDNFDKWTNLSDYDYIFTLKEQLSELKQYGNVFSIEDKPVFNQIKFILNDLYKRKESDFYHFVKEINFENVFPKINDYFKVLNSELFDDEWYHDTYNLEKNTDSVIHFLLIGYAKGYNPGPNFNTEDYYKCNIDVMLKDINPLIHYEKYGKKENRIFSIEEKNKRDYDAILNSPYFDKEWYESTYGIGEDTDSVDHYLHIGFIKRYNPSRDFSTQEYFESNMDVKEIQENPLVHYEVYGRNENRKLCFSDEQHKIDYDTISNSPYFDREWYLDHYDDLNGYEDPVYHYLHVGYTIGYDPGPDFSTDEYHACNLDVQKHGMNPLLHYERYGRREQRKLSFKD